MFLCGFRRKIGRHIVRPNAWRSEEHTSELQSPCNIVCRLLLEKITGFGQSGPFAHKPGYGYVFQGLRGLMRSTRVPDGGESAGASRTGVAVVDRMTGMYATSAVLAAVVQRQRSGCGQHIDLALLDVAVAMNANQSANYLVSGNFFFSTGSPPPNFSLSQRFAFEY